MRIKKSAPIFGLSASLLLTACTANRNPRLSSQDIAQPPQSLVVALAIEDGIAGEQRNEFLDAIQRLDNTSKQEILVLKEARAHGLHLTKAQIEQIDQKRQTAKAQVRSIGEAYYGTLVDICSHLVDLYPEVRDNKDNAAACKINRELLEQFTKG